MSACVRPARREPSFLRYLALASLNAADNFLSWLLAVLLRRLEVLTVPPASESFAPSLSRSEEISRMSDIYSSGVSIMLRSRWTTSLVQFFSDEGCIGVSVCDRPIACYTDEKRTVASTASSGSVGASNHKVWSCNDRKIIGHRSR